jgi:hypothetical protein
VRKDAKFLRLNDSAMALLDKAGGDGGASGYIEMVIQQRWEAWTHALRELREAGWSPLELLAACEALNGHILSVRSARSVSAALRDAAELGGLCERHDMKPKLWNERVAQVAKSDALAALVATIALEFWAGNKACERALHREP